MINFLYDFHFYRFASPWRKRPACAFPVITLRQFTPWRWRPACAFPLLAPSGGLFLIAQSFLTMNADGP